jgi:AcrR family transcriptional regulator
VRDAILAIATRSFVENGFERTRIDTIAEAADIAVGTVYNHFSTKSEILVAILLGDVETVMLRSHAVVGEPGPDSVRAVLTIARALIETMERRPRGLWRQLIGQSLIDEQLGKAYLHANDSFRELLRALFTRLQSNGALSTRFDVDEAAALTFSIANSLMYDYVRDDDVGVADFIGRCERQLAAAFR